MVGGGLCTMIGGVVLWKDTVAGRKYEYVKSEEEISQAVEGKTFVITGANSGIGQQTARILAEKKGKVGNSSLLKF